MNYKKQSRLAAIDIGTNSFHLVVVEIKDGTVRVLDRAKENVRLGSGSKDMKLITADAMQRGLRALKTFSIIAKSHRAPIRAVATSAVREAVNQVEFLKRVQKETGVAIEVVSGFEEARLIYLGVLQALPIFSHRVLCMDIGGGSVEFLVGIRGHAKFANSLKIGCIRLTQRFFSGPKIKPKNIEACRKHIRGFLSPVRREVKRHDFEFSVGSSGTIQNVANMIRAMRGDIMDASINNFTFTAEELSKITRTVLKAETAEQRLRITGLDPKRVDIITAGILVLEESFRTLRIKRMVVSEYALREGITYDYLQNRRFTKSQHHDLSNIRYSSVLHLAKTFHFDEEHSRQIAKLSLQIFDQTQGLHQLDVREREFLEYAALLHEVGLFISHAQHHRHSYYLIRNAELAGFTDTEKEIIANIARYHRKSHPKSKHEGFLRLSEKDRVIVKKLAAILRLADGLDRGHSKKVSDIKCTANGRKVTLNVKSVEDLSLEEWAVNMKKSLFEEVYHKKVILKK